MSYPAPDLMREGPDDAGLYQRRAAKRFSDAVAPLLKILTRDQVAAALGLRVRGKAYSRAQLRAWMRGGSAPLTVLEAAEDLRRLKLEEVIDLLDGVLPGRDSVEQPQKVSLSAVAGGLALCAWILWSMAATHSYDPRRWVETSWARLVQPEVHLLVPSRWQGDTTPVIRLESTTDPAREPQGRAVAAPPRRRSVADPSLPTAARGGGSVGGGGVVAPSSSARPAAGTPVRTQPASAGAQSGQGGAAAPAPARGSSATAGAAGHAQGPKGQGTGNGNGHASVGSNGNGNGNSNGNGNGNGGASGNGNGHGGGHGGGKGH